MHIYWRSLLLCGAVTSVTMAVPDTALEAQCRECKWVEAKKPHRCIGEANHPDRHPYCYLDGLFGGCHMCPKRPKATPEVALDGSLPADPEYMAYLRNDPKAGHSSRDGMRSVVFFQCGGAIVARRYEPTLERKLKRDSTVIMI